MSKQECKRTREGHHHIHNRATFALLCVRERERQRECESESERECESESESESLVYQGGEVPRERCLPA